MNNQSQPDLMQSMVHDQFAKMFDVIEDATVYSEKILDNGSRVTYRYTCAQLDLLTKHIAKTVEKIDPYRSHKISCCYKHNGKFAIDITTYGLD
jgi:hypothetical protein